jgi:uncharacterized protein YkwD
MRKPSVGLRRSVVWQPTGLGTFAAFTAQPSAAADLTIPDSEDSVTTQETSIEQALLDLTNTDREANGVQPLAFDIDTLRIARQRAAEQLDTPALSHYNAAGDLAFVDLLAEAALDYRLAGENLARVSSTDTNLTADVERALMDSPRHRRNILEKEFNRIAVGAATDGYHQITFAELYRN